MNITLLLSHVNSFGNRAELKIIQQRSGEDSLSELLFEIDRQINYLTKTKLRGTVPIFLITAAFICVK